MRRRQLVELEDLPWFPAVFRDAMTGTLRLTVEHGGPGRTIAAHLAPLVIRLGVSEIVDLCSGGGGPTVAFVRLLRDMGVDARATLTDLYPNVRAFQALSERSGGAIGYRAEPVDATAVPADLPGLRLVMNAFHHLPPEVARGVLKDAMDAGQPIALYEVAGREPLTAAVLLAAPLGVAAAVPFLRPFDWRWIPFTYVVPVLPLLGLWDGLVSALRIYSPEELQDLVAPLQRPGWRWDIGRVRFGRFPAHATYLHGYPEVVV